MRKGLGLDLGIAPGSKLAGVGPIFDRHLDCIWHNRQPGRRQRWSVVLRPWDCLWWYDVRASSALQGELGAGQISIHVGLVVNAETIISGGLPAVGFHQIEDLVKELGPYFLAVHRPRGISSWQPVRPASACLHV